jgi:hypothetical protein
MRRSLPTRVFAALLAIWFTMNMVGPASLHACPLHSGLSNAAAANGHAVHAGHAAQHESRHSGAPSRDSEQSCTCLGECCCAPVVAGPAPIVVALVAADPTIAVAITPLSDDVAPASTPAHALPFATAPPLATRSL